MWLAVALAAAGAQAGVLEVVNLVSSSSYRSYLDTQLYTHTGDNRGLGGAQHDPARANVFDHFTGVGLSASLAPFSYSGSTYYNVVGVQRGITRPNDVLIVGAHYDSAGTPGADDNASGVAGVMEAARVLAQFRFEATLVFAAFDREEQGLIGSTAFAAAHSGDHILGMVSLDMIAYNPGAANAASIYGRSASDPLKLSLGQALARYGGVSYTLQGRLDASDHAPFEARGFLAALLIEKFSFSNPNYHRPGDSVDTPGYIDYGFATQMTRGAVGWLAEQAVLVPEVAGAFWVGIVLLGVVVSRRARGSARRDPQWAALGR